MFQVRRFGALGPAMSEIKIRYCAEFSVGSQALS